MTRFLATTALILLAAHTSFAQQVTVQQPVVSTFGGATTVSVPDRGWTHLGSVNSARSGRVTTGPFRSGSSLGSELTGSSMSVGVFIHDLQAMDEAILAQGRGGEVADDLQPYVARLAERRNGTGEASAAKATDRTDHIAQAARFEQLARDAEVKGKASLARLHWQMAAKHGSTIAPTRLASRR
ncbi:MAG TPA: hypothetical protein VM165_03695 [Planctomycetaceae bacterium]|nr:hypothetical protein [Planctomycetaceae bacterium]